MKDYKNIFFEYYSSVFALLFFPLMIVAPKVAGALTALTLLVALPMVFFRSCFKEVVKNNFVFIFSFFLFGFIWIANSLYFSESSRAFDKPSRFILAVPLFVFLIKHPPKEHFLWLGVAFGGIATGCWALWEKIMLGSARVDAFTNAIQYGNISVLLSSLCLVGIGWAYFQKRRLLWTSTLAIGGFFGLLASALSGSRGGWIGLIFIVSYILLKYNKTFSKKVLIFIFTLVPFLASLLFVMPETGVRERVVSIYSDLSLYAEGEVGTSIGGRFELWKGSIILIKEKPFFGWGASGYMEKITELAEEGEIEPYLLSHSHNEVLDTFSKRGVLGLVSLLILYAMPLYAFYYSRKERLTETVLPLMLSGGVIAFSYFDFGLTQVFFAHNNGVIFYILSLILFYSVLNKAQQDAANGLDQ